MMKNDVVVSHRLEGFTLVEALVALGVIGLLTALLLPAVQQARESAARVRCASNLRQLGVALSNYIAKTDRMPPFSGLPNTKGRSGITLLKQYSVLSQLLPCLDQGALFNNINFDVGLDDLMLHPSSALTRGAEANHTAMTSVVSAFLCPSDGVTVSSGTAGSNYRVNVGNDRWPISIDGPFMDRLRLNTPAAISDGLSQTMAFAEKLRGSGGRTPAPRRDMYFGGHGLPWSIDESYESCASSLTHSSPSATSGGSLWIVGTLSQTCYNHVMAPNNAVPDCMLPNTNPIAGLAGARSNHPGGVQGLLCDGSVRFITNTVAREVWRALGSRAGGEIAPSANE